MTEPGPNFWRNSPFLTMSKLAVCRGAFACCELHLSGEKMLWCLLASLAAVLEHWDCGLRIIEFQSLHWKSPKCIKERLSTSAHTSQSPTERRKKRNNRDSWGSGGLSAMRSGLCLALLKPAALPVTPLPDPPLSLLLLLKCILCLVVVILFKLFIAWQCNLVASWCTLCVGIAQV